MAKNDPMNGGGAGYFPAIYQSALAQTAKDYDSIMGQYKGLSDSARSSASSNSSGNAQLNFTPLNPKLAEYQAGSDYGYLKDFVNTGGYSSEDVGNLRERAVSPIRSIYDSAKRDMNRQKNLQGGYSPNAGAVNAKMARESSYLMGDQLTKANAGIAEMVQRGKLAGAQALAPIEAQEAAQRNAMNANNANTVNDFMKFNSTMPLSYAENNRAATNNSFDQILKSIQGQQSTYGTNPALMNTFGSQVLNASNQAANFPAVPKGATSMSIPFKAPSQINGGLTLGVGR